MHPILRSLCNLRFQPTQMVFPTAINRSPVILSISNSCKSRFRQSLPNNSGQTRRDELRRGWQIAANHVWGRQKDSFHRWSNGDNIRLDATYRILFAVQWLMYTVV